ncbi:tyrosine-type recombinase/integrase [Haloarcula marismortui]|uniref:Tyrosine-type recombinase/integrase n=1 Tax=Haloarcula marismortui ATCC 33800 TaxID=662476 RepID=M0K180_9EURY|nr:tyrosine-type recombinase/integrase [Haloarcula sinaiiensis]EMA15187.1 XerC/D-like integrase [Haloarcula sinaiiensis ATCC 33800]QUJ71954.1 tyrosine-type recombinase/integrase [Haloarcula sinaiiensis ATCC 33800]
MSSTKYINVSNALENLKDQVDEKNYQAVHSFINEVAAEGVGESQQERQIYSLKTVIKKFSPPEFQLEEASESELKNVVAQINRSDYAEPTKAKFRASLKKFYKIQNGGEEHPDKVGFFSVHNSRKENTVSRDDLFTTDELKAVMKEFGNTRDRAFTLTLYETAARPGELRNCSIGDFTTNSKGDFIYVEGLKGTPDRTNQLVRAGRTLREWIAHHPLGGEIGDVQDSSAPLWVKKEQQECRNCGERKNKHGDSSCEYEPDYRDEMSYQAFRRRFKEACERAGIPENKRRPYNLRHTRLTEVATFMGYEQLNKFAGWVPGSGRAKVYVHLNNDDVNKAIREEYGVEAENKSEDEKKECPFCGTENQTEYSECRSCGRAMSLEKKEENQEKQEVIERLTELKEQGVLDRLEDLDA